MAVAANIDDICAEMIALEQVLVRLLAEIAVTDSGSSNAGIVSGIAG